MNIDIIIAAAAAALITSLATWLIVRGHYKGRMKEQEGLHQKRVADMEKLSHQAQENYDKALKQMRETIVASMTAETEKLLRKREKELEDENQTSMDGILKPLKESISAMERAMRDNATSHLETTTKLSEQLKNAVKDDLSKFLYQKTKRKPHRTPDSLANSQQTIRFDDDDATTTDMPDRRPYGEKRDEYFRDLEDRARKESADEFERELGFRPFDQEP